MRRLLLPVCFLLIAIRAYATPTCVGSGSSAVCTAATGNNLTGQTDVQDAVDACTAIGCTVVVPYVSGTTWHWNTSVLVDKHYNIIIRGGDGTLAHMPMIQQDGTTAFNMINYFAADVGPPKTTAEIFNLGFITNGQGPETKGNRILMQGITTRDPADPSKGGFRIHHNLFTEPWYDDAGYDRTCTIVSGTSKLVCTNGNFSTAGDSDGKGTIESWRVVWQDPSTNLTLFTKMTGVRDKLTVTTNKTTTITAAAGTFDASDVGVGISGVNIANGTTITGVTSDTQATINPAATGPATGSASTTVTLNPVKICTLNTKALATVSTAQTFHFTGTLKRLAGGWITWGGWVFGSIDHNEYQGNLLRFANVTVSIGDGYSPTGPTGGTMGDYSQSYLPASNPNDVAGSFDAVIYQDNIIHRGTGAFTDTDGSNGFCGGFLVARHNTTWASMASHGTREAGVHSWNTRLMEYYNNHYVQNKAPMQARTDTAPVESRSGEQLFFNNQITTQTGLDVHSPNSTQSIQIGPGEFGARTIQPSSRFYWCADGLNPLDLNQKASMGDPWVDQLGFKHYVDAGYTHSQGGAGDPNGANQQILKSPGGTLTSGVPITSSADVDTVTAGVDSDLRFGDVYGHITKTATTGTQPLPFVSASTGIPCLADLNWNQGAAKVFVLADVIVNGTKMHGDGTDASPTAPIPQNYFRGMIVRNAETPRDYGFVQNSGNTGTCFGIIAGNTAGSTTGTYTDGKTVTIYIMQNNPGAGGDPTHGGFFYGFDPKNGAGGTHIELRQIIARCGISGNGWSSVPLANRNPNGLNTIPVAMSVADSNGNNPYWTFGAPKFTVGTINKGFGGSWNWANWRRSGTGTPIDEVDWTNTFINRYVNRGFTWVKASTTVTPGSSPPSAIQPLFDRGYKWNPATTITADPNGTRIGADWGKTWYDPVITVGGQPAFCQSTVGPNSPDQITGSTTQPTAPAGTFQTPEFASLQRAGVGGVGYPDPMITPPTNTAPTFNAPYTITWPLGVASSATITTTGVPPVTSITVLSGKPSWVTFDNSASGGPCGNASASSATICGTPPNTIGGTINLKATNGITPDATQAFSLVVSSPTVNLDTPANGAIISPAPANISLTATANSSASTITKVEFYNGAALLNSDTTTPYAYLWPNVAAGNYTLTAKAYDALGGISTSSPVSITVQVADVAPTPAVLSVKP